MKNIYALPNIGRHRGGYRLQKRFGKPQFSKEFVVTGKGKTIEECTNRYLKNRKIKFAKFNIVTDAPINNHNSLTINRINDYISYRKLHFKHGTTYGDNSKLLTYFDGYLTEPIEITLNEENSKKQYKRLKDDETKYKITKNKKVSTIKNFVQWGGGKGNDKPFIVPETVHRMMNLLLPIHEEIKTEDKKRRFCEPDKLVEALNNPKNAHSPITFYLDCCFEFGWRRNEATAVTIGDIDFKNRTIRIHKGCKFNHWTGKLEVTDTKTKCSIRTLTMTEHLFKSLTEYINEFQLDKPDYYLFFGKTRDVPVPIQTLNNRIEKFLEDNNLPKHLKTHAWRHVNTTIMYRMRNEHFTEKDIARRLGQSSPEISMRTYLEYSKDDKAIANIFENIKRSN